MASGEAENQVVAATTVDGDFLFARVASVDPGQPSERTVPVNRIIKGERLRPADPVEVEAKRVSMRESGQISPIILRPAPDQPGWYILVAGLHRLEAALAEGWTDIWADVRNLTEDQARLVEVDENLRGPILTPLDRAIFIDVRLQVWGRLHPERVAIDGASPKRGRPANSDKLSQFLGDVPPTMGFSAETAADLGVDKRTVERALVIARGLSPDTRAKVSATKIAKNEGLLRQLAVVTDKDEQLKAAEVLVTGEAKGFVEALALATGATLPAPSAPTPVDETLKAFQAIWKKAPPTHRKALLHWLSGQSMPGDYVVMERANG